MKQIFKWSQFHISLKLVKEAYIWKAAVSLLSHSPTAYDSETGKNSFSFSGGNSLDIVLLISTLRLPMTKEYQGYH